MAGTAIMRVVLMFTVISITLAHGAVIVIDFTDNGWSGRKVLGVSHRSQHEPTCHEHGDTTPQSSNYGR